MPAANMMSGKLVDTFRQAKAPSEKRKAVLRSASKEAKPEAVAAAHQAPSEAGKLPAPNRGARCGALGVCAACGEGGCSKADETCDIGCPPVEEREALRQFDLTGRYGPCTGLTRLERCAPRLPTLPAALAGSGPWAASPLYSLALHVRKHAVLHAVLR